MDCTRNNYYIKKIFQRDSAGLHVVNIVLPKNKCRTKLYFMSTERKTFVGNDMQVMNYIWQRRMGNTNTAGIYHILKNPSYGMNTNKQLEELSFETSVEAKGNKQPANGNIMENAQTMTVNTHVCCPLTEEAYGGAKLFMTCTVTLHRYTNVKLIKSRNEVPMHC